MRRSRISLIYLATYLTGAGIGLLAAPEWVFHAMLSNQSYGAVIPRMVGALALALGILVIQLYRHRIDSLYPTLVAVRAMLCAIWIALYLWVKDPFFLVLLGVVGFGTAWTLVAYLADRRAS